MTDDEFRVEVELDDEEHGYSLGERLRAFRLDDEARERLGGDVIVTRDGSMIFLYARAEPQAREAERVVRDLLDEHGLSALVALTRWHPIEEEWKDASLPLPRTDEERQVEVARHEAAERAEAEAEGQFDWHVCAHTPSRETAAELAQRLQAEGISVARRWRYVVAGALTEERANQLARRVESGAPDGTDVWVEANVTDLPGPRFVLFGW